MIASEQNKSVGITLVTGFLGSGKSTLIRRVLTENHQQRIVVVENEFGDTAAIEQAIVTQGVGPSALEEFIELPNGCICCAAQEDLVDALTRLVEQKRGRFDHILVEASGLADPRPVAASFWVDAIADASLRLDAVVAVVDATTVETAITKHGDDDHDSLALKQLAVADVVLLNKMDLVRTASSADSSSVSDYVDRVASHLRAYGCFARIIPTTQCDVDIHELINIHAYESETAVQSLVSTPPEKFLHHAHVEDKPASTFTLTFKGVIFSSSLLDRALGHLLWDEPDEKSSDQPAQQIWRMKALVVMQDEPYKWIYQSVHTLFDDMVSSIKSADDSSLTSRFLFIGDNMDRDSIYKCLKQASVEENNQNSATSKPEI